MEKFQKRVNNMNQYKSTVSKLCETKYVLKI